MLRLASRFRFCGTSMWISIAYIKNSATVPENNSNDPSGKFYNKHFYSAALDFDDGNEDNVELHYY